MKSNFIEGGTFLQVVSSISHSYKMWCQYPSQASYMFWHDEFKSHGTATRHIRKSVASAAP
jgi:hypothetical protein